MGTQYKATRGNQVINFKGNGAKAAGFAASLEMSGWKVEKL